jgi:hypothetical protein
MKRPEDDMGALESVRGGLNERVDGVSVRHRNGALASVNAAVLKRQGAQRKNPLRR